MVFVMVRPRVLLVNDDGVGAPGIFCLKCVLESWCDVFVVAPLVDQSGVGRCLSLFNRFEVEDFVFPDGTSGYGLDGTPADCVLMGFYELMGEDVDLVVSGINLGHNLGGRICNSGTVGAALEGACCGVPGVAVSLEIDKDSVDFVDGEVRFKVEPDFSFAGEVLERVIRKVLVDGLPVGVDVLNVNVPFDPVDDELVSTFLADKVFDLRMVKDKGEDFSYLFASMVADEELERGSDAFCLRVTRRVSVSPLSLDMGSGVDLEDWLK